MLNKMKMMTMTVTVESIVSHTLKSKEQFSLVSNEKSTSSKFYLLQKE